MSIWNWSNPNFFHNNQCAELHMEIHDALRGMGLVIKWHCSEMQVGRRMEGISAALHILLVSLDNAKRKQKYDLLKEKTLYGVQQWQNKSMGYLHTAMLYHQASINTSELLEIIKADGRVESPMMRKIQQYILEIENWSDRVMKSSRGAISRFDIENDLIILFNSIREDVEILCAC